MKKYHLTRNYSILSLMGIAIVAIALSHFYWTTAYEGLKKNETEATESLTQALANSVWHRYEDFINNASTLDISQLANHPKNTELKQEVLQKVHGLRVIKVKIYNMDALTVFSSDPSQIGESKSNNAGFLGAAAGKIASEITFRDQFSTFENVIEDRNVLSSYIPVRTARNGAVEGVFEVYTDVTPLVEEIEATRVRVLVVVAALLALLYVFLLIMVRKADQIIKSYREEEIRRVTYYDDITGFRNRAGLFQFLKDLIAQTNLSKTRFTIMVINLNRIKTINDSFGHEVGNYVLKDISRRIQDSIGQDGVLCRIGGERFGVVFDGLTSVDQSAHLAQKILDLFNSPIKVMQRDIILVPSIGISFYPVDSTSPVQLVDNAEVALHNTSNQIGKRYAYYTEEFNAQAKALLELETELRRAIDKNEFVLFYQPRVSSHSNMVIGMEALIRWRNPNRGMVSPIDFIPVLEDTGLIIEVGEWVIEEACRQCKVWHDLGLNHLRVSVNLSTKQFENSNMVEGVFGALEKSGLRPEYLELEITESVLAQDTNKAVEILNQFRDSGICLSIDDFGTGYSSLSYLTHFPIHFLKVDRSFITDISSNPDNANITTAIVAMAKSLGLETVAEGIETEDQLYMIKHLGCDELQGFLFNKPVPANEFVDAVMAINKHSNHYDQDIAHQGKR